MTEKPSVEQLLLKAKEKEREYYWIVAAKFYKKASDQVLLEYNEKRLHFLHGFEIQERIGFCFQRAAMQARTAKEFKLRVRRAIEAYKEATNFCENLANAERIARLNRCLAIINYLEHWLTSTPSKKRKLLDDCLNFADEATKAFASLGNMLEYAKTYGELCLVFWHRVNLEWDRQVVKKIIEKGVRWGEKTIEVIHKLGDTYEIARANFGLAICLDIFKDFFVVEEFKEQEEYRSKIEKHLRVAVDLSQEVGDYHLAGLSHRWLGVNTGGEECIKHFEKTLECGKKIRDNFLKATGLDFLAHEMYWKALATEDPDQRRKLVEKAMQFYKGYQNYSARISFLSSRGGLLAPPGGYADHYLHLAMWEIDPKKKIEFLKKSREAGTKALKVAEDSDSPFIVLSMIHIMSKTLHAQARIESYPDEKRSLLEKALKYRKKAVEIMKQLGPLNYWDLGVMLSSLAEIEAELSYLEPEVESRKKLFAEAISHKEECLNLIAKTIPYYEEIGHRDFFAGLHAVQDSYGALLMRSYELTNNPQQLRKAIEIFEEAVKSASKRDMISLVAESYWKIARTEDILGEHLKAARSFKHASEWFMNAAKKMLQLRELYQDHAFYMQAWSEIEKARYHNTEKQYGRSREHYEKAAVLHKTTKRWSYLYANYLAWARLEQAEDLSRREQTEEAKDLFQQSADLFADAEKSIKKKLEEIEVEEEKTMAVKLVRASRIRHDYCLGRIAVEEAKILRSSGNSTASSEKYGSAIEIFQKIVEADDQSRKELQPIICLCQAWQKVTIAEARESSVMYGEAAKLFKKVREHAIDQQTALLALANNCFCLALEAGTEFQITRDINMFSIAKRQLEASANYYLKAGFKTGSDYAKATQRLFDAYVYMDKAETETDPVRKTKYYQVAEKLLQTSIKGYLRAKHVKKSEEVKRILRIVKEGKQLAVSLSKVLHAPSIASITTSFATPTTIHETAVGLERFEHAYLEAYLTITEKVDVGEELEIRLDLVNIAKNSCQLVRVDNIVPLDFRVIAVPSQHSIENGSIDLRGKGLEPLKTESINFLARATETGVANISPLVFYADDVGEFRTCRPKSATITVHPKLAFEFKIRSAQSVFSFLTDSFVEDYMRRRISLEKSGWRTLTQIVKYAKVSKWSVYGSGRRRGPAVSELERRGLVEARVFPGERGRGGRILKMRVSYEKEIVKRYVDKQIIGKPEK